MRCSRGPNRENVRYPQVHDRTAMVGSPCRGIVLRGRRQLTPSSVLICATHAMAYGVAKKDWCFMDALNTRAVAAGFLLALALTLVGVLVRFPAVGLFAGIATGSYLAARLAGAQGVLQGAGVAVLMLVAGVALLFLARGAMPSIDLVNATSLMWAAAILLLGPAVGLAARR